MTSNRQWRLAQRPTSLVDEHTFRLSEEPVPVPDEGQALLRTLYLSLDPTHRIWITDKDQYLPPVELGAVMRGGGIAQVVESRDPRFSAGDLVQGMIGWQDYTLTGGNLRVAKVPRGAPIPVMMNVAGTTGLTAYFGLTEFGQPKAGETLVVSAASGAVGSAVGQIGKILGLRVVGITSGADRCRMLVDELGFDAAVDRKAADWRDALAKATPDGIDIDFENVGGEIMDAVMERMNLFGRVVLCGLISGYNEGGRARGDFERILMRRINVRGFIILDFLNRFPEGIEKLLGWVKEGRLQHKETIVEGLEAMPLAMNRLFDGDKLGKLMVHVADPQ